MLSPLPADACSDSGMGPTDGSLGQAGCTPVGGAGGGGAAEGLGGSRIGCCCCCCCCCCCLCDRSADDPLVEVGMEEVELAVVVTEALLNKRHEIIRHFWTRICTPGSPGLPSTVEGVLAKEKRRRLTAEQAAPAAAAAANRGRCRWTRGPRRGLRRVQRRRRSRPAQRRVTAAHTRSRMLKLAQKLQEMSKVHVIGLGGASDQL